MAAASDRPRDGENGHVGPHPSFIQVAQPYVFEQKIEESIAAIGVSEAKEDNMRLKGVAWIDSVRKALQLPVRTFNTAVVYYHKFRLVHADNEYNFIDAAAAALFAACKIEDTLKKSKEILCAAYNLKLPAAEQLSSDDPLFEAHSKSIIGLERLMLEASGFDFRSRDPQKLLLKLAKQCRMDRETVAKTAYNMSLDLYRTFAPLKQSTSTMAIACLELSAMLHQASLSRDQENNAVDYERWATSRAEVMETLLDLLDLYTHHRNATVVGQEYPLDTFINIRITLNQESSSNNYPRFTEWIQGKQPATNGSGKGRGNTTSPSSPHHMREGPRDKRSPASMDMSSTNPRARAGERGRDGTIRFMLDAERANEERRVVDRYFKVEEEEYEVEVERERGVERERRRDGR